MRDEKACNASGGRDGPDIAAGDESDLGMVGRKCGLGEIGSRGKRGGKQKREGQEFGHVLCIFERNGMGCKAPGAARADCGRHLARF